MSRHPSRLRRPPATETGRAGPADAHSNFPPVVMFVIGAAVLVLGCLIVYLPALRAGYIWDDDDYVTQNPAVQSAGGLKKIWFDFKATPQYYPLVFTTFWLEHRLWGLRPFGYHLVNVLLHAAGTILFWWFLRRLGLRWAWVAAAVFAVHPVCVESVAWITERKNVLSGVFVFACLLVYDRCRPFVRAPGTHNTRRLFWLMGAWSLFAAALLCKTAVTPLPAAILVLLWWKHGRFKIADVLSVAPMFLLAVAMGLVTVYVESKHVGAKGEEWSLGLVERCLLAGRIVWFYACKLVLPIDLAIIYPRWTIDAAQAWQWLFPLGAIALPIVLWLLRHQIGRGPLAAVLVFGGGLFPVMGFFNVYMMRFSYAADHFQYLPGAAMIVLLTVGLMNAMEWIVARAAGETDRKRRMFPNVVIAALLVILSVLSRRQTHVYTDLFTLWYDTLEKNPDAWIAHTNLSGMLVNDNARLSDAIHHGQEAVRLNPKLAKAHNNLGMALAKANRGEEALHEFGVAIDLQPEFTEAYSNLGSLEMDRGNPDAAIRYLRRAIEIEPRNAEAHYNLGRAHAAKKDFAGAIRQYEIALRTTQNPSSVYNSIGTAWGLQGRYDEAVRAFEQAIRADPGNALARQNLQKAAHAAKSRAG